MKIFRILEVRFTGETKEEVIEVDDDLSANEIDKEVSDWALDHISWGWKKVSDVRIVVTGGRNYSDYEAVKRELDKWLALANAMQAALIVIEGGATGADALARRWCEENPDSVHHIREDAKWTDLDAVPCVLRRRKDGTLYNAAAGGIRNQKMLDAHLPSILLQFPGGKGTADMVKRAHAAKVRVKECT